MSDEVQNNPGAPAEDALPRSPLLMSRHDAALLIVDMQEKLLPLVDGGRRVLWNCERLVDACRALEVPVAGTEQYPQGLAPTVPSLAERIGPMPDKLAFSSGSCRQIFADWGQQGIGKILIGGIETHVCVQQTVYDLLASGFAVYLAVDAVGSRFALDHQTALGRMDSAGAVLTTAEAAMFELCERAGTPEFKQISQLVKKAAPE